MNSELEKQLDALIGKISNKEDFDQVKDQLLKRGIESLLKAVNRVSNQIMFTQVNLRFIQKLKIIV